MKIVYKCEICGCVYDIAEKAIFCETYKPLSPTKFKIGQEIKIKDYNGGIFTDKIVNIKQGGHYVITNEIHLAKNLIELIEKLDKLNNKKNWYVPHEWILELENEHQTTDEDYSGGTKFWNIDRVVE